MCLRGTEFNHQRLYVENTKLGIQRLECVRSGPFINCVNPLIYARNGDGPRDAQNKDKHSLFEVNRFRKSSLSPFKSKGIW